MESTQGNKALAPSAKIIFVIKRFPGGITPSFSMYGNIIIAAGISLSTNISSTVKFVVTAKRVPTKNAAQIVTVTIAAT